MAFNPLSLEEKHVIEEKGTEMPYTGEYDNFPDAITQTPDPDGMRTEISCSNCGAHLGHVFTGERITGKDTRHCVNSLSIRFVPKEKEMPEVLHE